MTNFDQALQKEMTDTDFKLAYKQQEMAAQITRQIRNFRRARGMTQAELAEKIGTTQSGVSYLEDETKAQHSLSTLVKVADALDCKVVLCLVANEHSV